MGITSEHRPVRLYLLMMVVFMTLSACGTNGPTGPTVTSTANNTQVPKGVTPTSYPSPTPTPQPLGSAGNPVVLAWVSPSNNAAVIAAEKSVADFLINQTGINFQVIAYDSYAALLADLESGKVMVTWLPPFTYILANQKGLVDIALMTNHFGVYSYGTMFLANIDSGFTSYFDPNSNKNTADVSQALAQFDGKRPCLVEPKSASGYVVPLGILSAQKITFQEPVLSQTFNAVIRSLYIQGICDYGATYAISGDPRTASSVQDTLPGVIEQIEIIWRSDSVIPNIGLAYYKDLPKGMRQLITDALVNWVKTPDGKQALTGANQYDIADLRAVDDSYYDPLRKFLKDSAVDIDSLVGR